MNYYVKINLILFFVLIPMHGLSQNKNTKMGYEEPRDEWGVIHDIPDISVDEEKEFYIILYEKNNVKYRYFGDDGVSVFEKRDLPLYLIDARKKYPSAYVESIY
jgi:hypothetical protein